MQTDAPVTDEERLDAIDRVHGYAINRDYSRRLMREYGPVLDALVLSGRKAEEETDECERLATLLDVAQRERDDAREWLAQTALHAGVGVLYGEDAFNAITAQGESLSKRADAAEARERALLERVREYEREAREGDARMALKGKSVYLWLPGELRRLFPEAFEEPSR